MIDEIMLDTFCLRITESCISIAQTIASPMLEVANIDITLLCCVDEHWLFIVESSSGC